MVYRKLQRVCSRYCYSRLGKIVWYFLLTVIAIYCFIQVQVERTRTTLDTSRFNHGEETRHFANVNANLPNNSYQNQHQGNGVSDRDKNSQNLVKHLRADVYPTIAECPRKPHLVYIKTHKTGSCTTTNLIYRAALKYDWPTLQFVYFPYPYSGLPKFYIHSHKFLESKGKKLRTTFSIAADHMRYERTELDEVMEGQPLYTTTLRAPADQLRSMFSYFDLSHKLEMSKDIIDKGDPVEEYIMHKDKYAEPKIAFRVDNRNADTLGFNRSENKDQEKVDAFVKKIDKEFGLVMIKEYSDESNILLRRKMCWDMSDILYISINLRTYKNRQAGLKPEVEKVHRSWSNVDYILYEHFNQSLWKQIQNEGESFQEELILYRIYLKRTQDYCKPMYDILRKNKTQIYWLHNNMKPLTFPRTKFHEEFTVGVVFCTLARVDIAQFYNIMKVHSFPQICDFTDPHYINTEVNKFKVNDKSKTIEMNRGYCAPNPEKTLVPLEAIKTALYL